jgi:hypothetical protein
MNTSNLMTNSRESQHQSVVKGGPTYKCSLTFCGCSSNLLNRIAMGGGGLCDGPGSGPVEVDRLNGASLCPPLLWRDIDTGAVGPLLKCAYERSKDAMFDLLDPGKSPGPPIDESVAFWLGTGRTVPCSMSWTCCSNAFILS